MKTKRAVGKRALIIASVLLFVGLASGVAGGSGRTVFAASAVGCPSAKSVGAAKRASCLAAKKASALRKRKRAAIKASDRAKEASAVNAAKASEARFIASEEAAIARDETALASKLSSANATPDKKLTNDIKSRRAAIKSARSVYAAFAKSERAALKKELAALG